MKLEKRYRFTISSFNDILEDIVNKRISYDGAVRAITAHLENEDFLKEIFNPPETMDRDELQKETKAMYIFLAHRKVLRCLIDAISEIIYDGRDLNRSVATFMNTVALAGIQASKNFEDRLREDVREGKISRRESSDEYDHIERYNEMLVRLIRTSTKIIKRQAKRTARASDLPTPMVRNVYLMVPDPKFINRYQIGFYLDKVLQEIYETADSYTVLDSRRVDWTAFFQDVFDKRNLVEVANYILLEGLDRIQNYKGSRVKEVWNDLTKFALDTLEEAPEQIQQQMLDLYTKRVSRMFQNNAFELRVDLRHLDPLQYPKLSEMIVNYADKLTDIIKEASKKSA